MLSVEQLRALIGEKPKPQSEIIPQLDSLTSDEVLPEEPVLEEPVLKPGQLSLKTDFFSVGDSEEIDISEKELLQDEPEEEFVDEEEPQEALDDLSFDESTILDESDQLLSEPEVEELTEAEPEVDEDELEEIPEDELEDLDDSKIEAVKVDQPEGSGEDKVAANVVKVEAGSLVKTVTRPKKPALDRTKLKKSFDSLVKNQKVQTPKNVKTRKKRRLNTSKAKSVIKNNAQLFSQKKLNLKWKSPPLSPAQVRKYMPLVKAQFKKYWKIALEQDPSLEVLVKIKIAKSGGIIDYEIVETSGNWAFDQSVRNIFRKTKTLVPLPDDFSGVFTEIGFKFNSSVVKN